MDPIQAVRRYLPQLARRVHPDLFMRDPVARALNLESLQSLNEVVASTFTPPTGISPPSADLRLRFHCRVLDGSRTPPLFVDHTLSARGVAPPLIMRSVAPAARERAEMIKLAASFLHLCEKAGVEVEGGERAGLEQEAARLVGLGGGVATARRERQLMSARGTGALRARVGRVGEREEFEGTFRNTVGEIDAAGGRRKVVGEEDLAEAALGPSPPLLAFLPDLTEAQRKEARTLFRIALAGWMMRGAGPGFDVPVLFTRTYSRSVPGLFVLPWDFDAAEVRAHVEEHLDEVRKEFAEVQSSM
ncbi:hypothetical protein BDK51DRAFT_45286 [Blyttiomyces helicus]|uniref:DUF4460 domain-containing protein n=1 Tax=Blyttiomyces helicus TaxID=388810 RepID=A0A4P9WGJ1_9FUNG|nr:hypothetical protein BDK51DRAFT_45286 [Blyttiomyces helicus]|eukprot:RKO91824.1 hypothetical protein BDK51DRAFT_45286 [Blyttiomyces helicus]